MKNINEIRRSVVRMSNSYQSLSLICSSYNTGRLQYLLFSFFGFPYAGITIFCIKHRLNNVP